MLTTIVRGEEELGVQRFCLGCRSWWPFTDEFFVVRPYWTSSRCRSCLADAQSARQAAKERWRVEEAREARNRAQRPRWRLVQRRWRERQRSVA